MPTIKRKNTFSALAVLAILAGGFVGQAPRLYAASSWAPTLIVNTEAFQVIDDTDSAADLYLQFGGTLNKRLTYDRTEGTFRFDDDLEVIGTISGSHLHAQDLLTTSGSAVFRNTTDSTSAFRISDADGGIPVLNVDTVNEFVGIGTSSPNVPLEIQRGSQDMLLLRHSAGGHTIFSQANNDDFKISRDGTGGTDVSLQPDGDLIIGQQGNVGVGTSAPDTKLEVIGTMSGSHIRSGSGLIVEQGRVGIGTDSPIAKLHVSGGAITLDYDQPIRSIRSGGTNESVLAELTNTDQLQLYSGKLNVSNNGRVGVGTTAPDTELDVIGAISGSSLTVSGLQNCDTIDTDATGNFSCGTDDAGGGSTGTGSLQAFFDNRYVSTSGDTMTGSLTIANEGSGPGLNVLGTASASTLHFGETLSGSGWVIIQNIVDSTTAFQIFDADGGNPVFNVDTTNERVGIGTSTPDASLEVIGIASGGTLRAQDALYSSGAFIADAPTNATLLGGVQDSSNLSAAYGIQVVGRYAYVTSSTDDSLRIIDIAKTGSAAIVGGVKDGTNLDGIRGIKVVGRYAYVVNNFDDSLRVIDVSDPTNPYIAGGLKDASNLEGAFGIDVVGRYAYIATNFQDSLEIIDISDPFNPVRVGGVADATVMDRSRDVVVSGRYAYLGSYSGYFNIIDISDPTNPVLIKTITDASSLNGAQYLEVVGRYAYITSYVDHSFRVIDVSDPDTASIVGGIQDTTNLNSPMGVDISGHYAFVTSEGNDSVQIIDITDPRNPVIVGSVRDTTNLNGARGIDVVGRYAYVVSVNNNSMRIIDLAGIEAATAYISNLEAGQLTVTGDSTIGRNVTVNGGLQVGNGVSAFGNSAFHALSGTALRLSSTNPGTNPTVEVTGSYSGSSLQVGSINASLSANTGSLLVSQDEGPPEWKSPTGGMMWYVDGDLSTGTDQGAVVIMPFGMTLTDVDLKVKTAPTGSSLIIDINEEGTTLFSTRPEIDASATREDGNHVFSDTTLAAGSEITIDIDQVGSTIAGSSISIILKGTRHY